MTDHELVARIARSAGGKAGYKQLGARAGPGRRTGAASAAGATGAADGARRTGEAGPRTLEHSPAARRGSGRHARESLRRAARSASRRLRFCPAQPVPARLPGTEDIFIPPNEINGAMQGDQVLVEVEPPKADGRRQGRIVRVLLSAATPPSSASSITRADRAMGHNVVPLRRPHDPAHPHSARQELPPPPRPPRRIAFSAERSNHGHK
jgi:ribonuclease R